MTQRGSGKLNVAVVGAGISGLSAAWLLCQKHDVTVYEQADRIGGHSNTIDVPGRDGTMPVDMGFIVYNPQTYPNLVALFRHLAVATQASDMSFAVSLRGGALEYAGTDLAGLFAQKRNLLSPRFWSMMRDLVRFYRDGARDARSSDGDARTLGDYLAANGYGEAFVQDHLLPMASAIWSTPARDMLDYPAAAFLRFCNNHGLLELNDRPEWRTVTGGAREYVTRLSAPFADRIRLGCGVASLRRHSNGVSLLSSDGENTFYDHVVIAAHADQALSMLDDPTDAERSVLGALRYRSNNAVMHRDISLMPTRQQAWCSWNYIGDRGGNKVYTSYWMNRLQGLPETAPVFVTLDPQRPPAPKSVVHQEVYAHPQFDLAAMRAQRHLWKLQGYRGTWYCGAYFGAGFHEDGLQAGLAVAEALGGVRRPWTVAAESGRISLPGDTRRFGAAA